MIKLSNLSGVAEVVEAVTIEHVMKTDQSSTHRTASLQLVHTNQWLLGMHQTSSVVPYSWCSHAPSSWSSRQ